MKPIGSKLPGPHPEEPRSSRGVSKDGRESMRCGHPSRRIGSADAPQDEVQGACRYDSNFGNAVLVLLGDSIRCDLGIGYRQFLADCDD